MAGKQQPKMTRTDWAVLQRLTPEQRIAVLEKDGDEADERFEEITQAIRVQTRAIMAGMVTIILFLAGMAFRA